MICIDTLGNNNIMTLTLWEAHDVENSVELIMMIRVTGLDIFLSTMEDWFRCHQFGKNAPNGPDICKDNATIK